MGDVRMPNFSATVVIHMNNDLTSSQIDAYILNLRQMAHGVPFYSEVGAKWSDIIFSYIQSIYIYVYIYLIFNAYI